MSAFDDLLNDPHTFLWKTPISIAGSNVIGTTPFAPVLIDNTQAYQNPAHANDCTFAPGIGADHRDAWNVPMIKNSTVADTANLSHVHVTDVNTPLILTGKLSGCCIVVAKVSATELRISHVQPGGTWANGAQRGDGDAMETTLRAGTTMGGVAATHFCGVSTYRQNGTHANVVGVATGGAWTLWVQATSGTFQKKVTHLSRIL